MIKNTKTLLKNILNFPLLLIIMIITSSIIYVLFGLFWIFIIALWGDYRWNIRNCIFYNFSRNIISDFNNPYLFFTFVNIYNNLQYYLLRMEKLKIEN